MREPPKKDVSVSGRIQGPSMHHNRFCLKYEGLRRRKQPAASFGCSPRSSAHEVSETLQTWQTWLRSVPSTSPTEEMSTLDSGVQTDVCLGARVSTGRLVGRLCKMKTWVTWAIEKYPKTTSRFEDPFDPPKPDLSVPDPTRCYRRSPRT